jgi:hypothetical protein
MPSSARADGFAAMEDRMRLDRIAAALAAASLLTASPRIGIAAGDRPWAWPPPSSCTLEVRTCLEKLDAWVRFDHRSSDRNRIEDALLEFYATDPKCALLLEAAGWHGH